MRTMVLMLMLVLIKSGISFADQQDASEIEKGKQLFMSNRCFQCHGMEGKGDGGAAKLFNPAPTNFHHPKEYQHGNEREDIIHSIKHGIKDIPTSVMPSFSDLTEQELKEISSYLLSLQDK